MTLKVLSLNILEGGLFFDNILKLLNREQPDIFSLQEVYNGSDPTLSRNFRSMEILTKAFPEYHYYFAPELLCITPEGKVDIGNAVFSKFPITESSSHFFKVKYGEFPQVAPGGDWSKSPQNMAHCVIDVEGTQLNIFNLHGVWGFDGEDNTDRDYMGEVVLNQIKNKNKIMLMGDFNLQPHTRVVKNIEQQLTNVFKDELETSFNLAHKDLEKSPGYASAVVDMFFVSRDITVINKSVPSDDVSDHLPLLCELEV